MTAHESTRPLRGGVVGSGYAGETHTTSYQQIRGVEVVALAGLEPQKLRELDAAYAVPHMRQLRAAAGPRRPRHRQRVCAELSVCADRGRGPGAWLAGHCTEDPADHVEIWFDADLTNAALHTCPVEGDVGGTSDSGGH